MVKAMDYRKKLEVSQDLKRCIQLVKDIHAVLSSEVRFLTQVNINRFGQWARHPGSPVNFDIRRKDGHLHFDGYKPQTLPIPEDLWSPMLPTFNAPN